MPLSFVVSQIANTSIAVIYTFVVENPLDEKNLKHHSQTHLSYEMSPSRGNSKVYRLKGVKRNPRVALFSTFSLPNPFIYIVKETP